MVCAQEACWQLELESVVLTPLREAPHRQAELDPGPEERYELCRAAVAGDERLRVSRVELDRPGPSYTVDTLRLLREESPQDDFVLIMGADAAVTLHTWREPEELLRLATVAVAERENVPRDAVEAVLRQFPGANQVSYFRMPGIAISSTMVRERIAQGRPIRYLVPEGVGRRIEDAGLYRPGGAS